MIKTEIHKIKEFQDKQMRALIEEEKQYGGYENWYNKLANVRDYIKKVYVRYSILNKVYRHKIVHSSDGDIIDWHALSYLAPMTIKGRGWGGRILTATEQIKIFSDYITERGKRFIYAALPNKGVVRPERIVPSQILENTGLERPLGGGGVNIAPQYRKIISELISDNVEVIDFLPLFLKDFSDIDLFSKKHHISPYGASLVAKGITDYLSATTSIEHKSDSIFGLDEYTIVSVLDDKPSTYLEKANIISIRVNNDKICYLNQLSEDSRIAIFGDCNLQAYQNIGAGISANIAYNLNYPVHNAGRQLVFGGGCPITKKGLEELLEYDIIIYTNFVSAPFVRMVTFSKRHPSLRYSWSTINLTDDCVAN